MDSVSSHTGLLGGGIVRFELRFSSEISFVGGMMRFGLKLFSPRIPLRRDMRLSSEFSHRGFLCGGDIQSECNRCGRSHRPYESAFKKQDRYGCRRIATSQTNVGCIEDALISNTNRSIGLTKKTRVGWPTVTCTWRRDRRVVPWQEDRCMQSPGAMRGRGERFDGRYCQL